MTRLTTLDLPNFQRASIGFDKMFNDIQKQFANSPNGTSYPPYNIVLISEDEYVISLAVAGFGMDDLEIIKDNNILRIEGRSPDTDDDEVKYLHRGIAARSFRREFTIADHVEVIGASLELGMLTIHLRQEVPDELQPKRIEISSTTKTKAIESKKK